MNEEQNTTVPEENRSDTAAAPMREPSIEEIKAYQHTKRLIMLAGIGLSLVYWLAWVWLADDFVGWLDGFIDGRWAGLGLTALAMLGLNVLISLPMDFYSGYTVEHRYGLSNQTAGGWVSFQVKSWLVGAIIGGLILVGLYAAVWYSGAYWGVYVWIGVLLFSIVLAKLFPLVILPLFYPAKPLDRPELADRLKELAGQANMEITGIFDLELSKETKKANAMLAGLGSSRRVYLSDTLLESFGNEEISVVFAHELGHHIRNHIYKMIALSAVVTSALVALIWWRLNPHAGTETAWTGGVAAMAQVMLISNIFPLLIGPVTNAISRHFERQADTDALRLTDAPGAFRSAFEKLIKLNLADPTPPRWEEIMFDDHPAMNKRIAMAERYAAQKA